MSNFGLRVSIRFLVYFQIFVDAFRLGFIRVLVKVANELEDISFGIDEIIDEKVFGYTEEDYWLLTFRLDEDNSDA
jgi:hypothetical protein